MFVIPLISILIIVGTIHGAGYVSLKSSINPLPVIVKWLSLISNSQAIPHLPVVDSVVVVIFFEHISSPSKFDETKRFDKYLLFSNTSTPHSGCFEPWYKINVRALKYPNE